MPRIIRKIFLVLIVVLCFGFSSSEHDNFPVPKGIKNLLFYVQRSFNKNTLIYQLNINEKNELNESEPISVFWMNYAGKGDLEQLNYIQRKYAYGINVHQIDKEKKKYSFHFVSYKKQILYLIETNDNKFHVFGYFNNHLLIVNRIFVQIEGGSFWTPKVKYIEIFGKDPAKNEELVEKIII